MKRMVLLGSLMLVFTALVVTWVITGFVYQNILFDAQRQNLRSLTSLSAQFSAAEGGAKRELRLPQGVAAVYYGKQLQQEPSDVEQAFTLGAGETLVNHGILGGSSVSEAVRLSDGTVLRLSAPVNGTFTTLWCILPALLLAFVLAWRAAAQLVQNVRFVFKGVSLTLERAVNEGGVTVRPAPELLEYREFALEARELAELSTQVSQRVQSLFVENKRVDYLLNNMNEGLAVFDRDLRILTINRGALAFFETDGDMKGQNILRLTHQPAVEETLRRVTESGAPAAMDIKSPGGTKTLQLSMSAVYDENEGKETADGQPRRSDGAILIISDVTSLRLTEQIRSDFVANASHELKTPLTSIKGFSELLDSGIISDPGKSRGYLEHIRQETERMIMLINDILKLSELESSYAERGKAQVSLKLIAQKVCGSLVNQITRRGVTVSVEGDIGSMEASSEHMEQMLLNLVDNAVKYNRECGRVDIRVEQAPDSVSVTVSDTGMGIPAEAQGRVFERFYRVDKSRSRKLGGTGLGLSIVKHIVELYHGTVSLKSGEGKGTAITVKFPCA